MLKGASAEQMLGDYRGLKPWPLQVKPGPPTVLFHPNITYDLFENDDI